jgi:hypothetical protein
MRTCEHCSTSLEGRRRHARYCGGPCRAAASRIRGTETHELVPPVPEPTTTGESARKRTCEATAPVYEPATPTEEALAERLRLAHPDLWHAA